MSSAANLVKCPCGAMMEATAGHVDYNAKDDTGQVMSPMAAIHMSKYRIRCRTCDQNFCSGCQAQPYHAGKNCEEYKRFQLCKKCRFCGNELAN